MDRNRRLKGDWELGILDSEEAFSCTADFDCGNKDLNDFFSSDALEHKKLLLAETYSLSHLKATGGKSKPPVAFISFLNDCIVITAEERKDIKGDFWRYVRKAIPFPKRNYPSFPAVKIGRLGVSSFIKRKHIGTHLLNLTKELFTTDNRTGCRFLTVDAYNTEDVISFYKYNDFDFLWDEDEDSESRIMFFDLMSLKRNQD